MATGSEQLTFEVTAFPFDNFGTPAVQTVAVNVFAFALAITAEDRNVNSGDNVSLHGAANTSPSHPLTIAWTQTHGTPTTLINANTFNPTFTAPTVLAKDALEFNLHVEVAGAIRDVKATVIVNPASGAIGAITPIIPVVTAKVFQAAPGAIVPLKPLHPPTLSQTVMWTQLSGAPIAIANPATASASFVMPHGLSAPIIVALAVTDTLTAVVTSTHQAIHPATAITGPNTTSVLTGSPTTVHSTTPPSGGADVHAWLQNSGPTVMLSNANTAAVSFTAPATTTAGQAISLQHTLTPPLPGLPVITTHTVNLVPSAMVLHRNVDAFTGADVTVHADGVASTTYAWSQTSGPMVSLSSNNTATTMFTAPLTTSTGTAISLQSIATTPAVGPTPAKSELIVHTIKLIPATAPLAVSVSAGVPSLLPGAQGVFHSSVSGGTGPYNYVWTPKTGPVVTLDLSTIEAPSFTVPTVASNTLLEYTLQVTDAAMTTQSVDASVTIQAAPPFTIHVYQSAAILSTTQAGLHASSSGGSGSFSYVWTQTTGPAVTLAGTLDYAPTFIAPIVTSTTLLGFDVTVTDSLGAIVTGNTFVTVLVAPPSAVPDLTVTTLPQLRVNEGDNVVLSVIAAGGDGSYTYSWLAKTAGFTLDDITLASPSFTAPIVAQDQTLSLIITVMDGSGKSKTLPVSVLVLNKPLYVHAGNNVSLAGSTTTLLHAVIITPTVPPYSYAWTEVSGATLTLTDANTANPLITLPVNVSAGYELSVTVTDANGETATDNVLLSANFPLSADAGSNQTVSENAPVSLHGLDVGGLGATTVGWVQLSGTVVTLSNASTLNPNFTAPITASNNQEELVFELVAMDSSGRITRDTVSVFVEPVLPQASVSGAASLLESTASSLTASASGGTAPYTYSWTQSGDIASTITSATTVQAIGFTTSAFNQATDHDTLQVTITDSRGHTVTASHTFVLHQLPATPVLTLVENIASTIASGTNTPATVGVTGATAPLTFAWSDNSTGSFAPSAAVQNPGYTAPVVGKDSTVVARINVTDSASASATATQSVLVTAVPLVLNINGDTTVLRGHIVNLHATVTGGIQPYLLEDWKNATLPSDPTIGTGMDIALDTSTLVPGNYKITYTTFSSPPGFGIAHRNFTLTVKNPPRTLTVPANANLKENDDFMGVVTVAPTFAGESFAFTVTPGGSGPAMALSTAMGSTTNISASSLAASVDETYTVTATLGTEVLSTTFTLQTAAAVSIPAPVRATVCSGSFCGALPAGSGFPGTGSIDQCPVDQPFALTTMNNTVSGKKTFTKSCGSLSACGTDWWQLSSDRTECVDFDVKSTYNFSFQCTYCCTTDNCNKDAYPARNTLLNGNLYGF